MFFSIPNLFSSVVTTVDKPWDTRALWGSGTVKPDGSETAKAAFRTWCADPHTESSFLCGYEGITPALRLSDSEADGNVPYRIHSVIVDYDADFDPVVDIPRLAKAGYSEFLPAYAVRTFSNRLRLIWLIEEPLFVCSMHHAKEVQKLLLRKLKLTKWHGALDHAFGKPSQYYHIGMEWYPLHPDRMIPASHMSQWLFEAASNISLIRDVDKYEVPLDRVAEEVEARYPGRWKGPFAEGLRGVVFWEPEATNPTAAIVHKEGMLFFSHGGGFKTWKQLFGQAFVEKYEADRTAVFNETVAYDGKGWWKKNDDGHWMDWSNTDFTQKLRNLLDLHSTNAKRKSAQLDSLECRLKEQLRVFRAAPFLYYPPGRFRYEEDGKWYLNICSTNVIQPAVPMTEGKMTMKDLAAKAPFIWSLLRNLFVDDTDDAIRDEPQLEYLLAWLKHAYECGYNHTPAPGLAVFLEGPTGIGKTLLNRFVIGGLLGGSKDASSHLHSGSKWTEDLAATPLMSIDDNEASSNQEQHYKFTNNVKKYVANALMIYEQKFKASAQIPWNGRIMVTLNTDAQSRRILPDMDISSKDKIMMLKCAAKARMTFPARDVVKKSIACELPVLARFLLDWTPPSYVRLAPSNRFGLVPYQHPNMLLETMHQGNSGSMLELLNEFLPHYAKEHPADKYWEGTVTTLANDLQGGFGHVIMNKWTIHGIRIALGVLASRGLDITSIRTRDSDADEGRIRKWRIALNLFDEKPVAEEGGEEGKPCAE